VAQLPDKAIKEFQDLWNQTTDEDLNVEEASNQAHKLLITLESLFKK
jgi:hypothetical protein